MSNDDVIDLLNDLIENCKDGEYGFRSCAEHAKAPELKNVFTARAEECRRAAEELKQQVIACGGKPENTGTAAGALHRGWVAARSVLTGYTDHAILEECERGEDVAVKKYRAAMEKPLPEQLRMLIERQLLGAQRNHDQVKALRDRFPANA
jgi:uncharacterized protein (TIGR02284 family)